MPGHAAELDKNLAQVTPRADFCLDCFLPAVLVRDFDHVYSRVLVELVKFEVAVVVACRLGHDSAVLEEPDARALDAIDDASGFGRDPTPNEPFPVPPQIPVIDPP